MGRAKRTPRAIASPNSPSTSTHTRETPFPYRETPFSHGETPFYYGETPLMLKKAFVALCFLLDGGIPRYGGVKNAAPAANWAQKRVTCRVPSVSTAIYQGVSHGKKQSPVIRRSISLRQWCRLLLCISLFFLPSLFSRPRQRLNIQPLAEVPVFSASSVVEHSTACSNAAGSLRTPAERESF